MINEDKYINEILIKETLPQLYSNIFTRIDLSFKISQIKTIISNSKKEDMLHNWEIFKEKELSSFFCSFITSQYLSFLTYTNIIICKSLKNKGRSTHDILSSIWELLNDVIDKIIVSINNNVISKISRYEIKDKVNDNQFINKIRQFFNDIIILSKNNGEIIFNIHSSFLDSWNKVINELESLEFDENQPTKMVEIEQKMNLYRKYRVFISSKLFINFLLLYLNMNFEHVIQKIQEKMKNSEFTLAKCLLILDEIRINFFDINTLNNIKVFNEDGDLKFGYVKIIEQI